MPFSEQLLRRLPKTDLHVHLDGSLRIETLIELARERRAVVCHRPSPMVFASWCSRSSYLDLHRVPEGLRVHGRRALPDPDRWGERPAYGLLNSATRTDRYVEVRFAPQLHVHGSWTSSVLKTVRSTAGRSQRRDQRLSSGYAAGTDERIRGQGDHLRTWLLRAGFSAHYRSMLEVLDRAATEVYSMARSSWRARWWWREG